MDSSRIKKIAFAGSVDDGKSTLIGRIFHDRDLIMEDQKGELLRASIKRGSELNLALFTDGLRSEREQGITIDIAHRFFTTPHGRYHIIDCPGHHEYLRNMITGCSQAGLVVILVDAIHGLTEQTKRHIAVTQILRNERVVFAINKMDLCQDPKIRFQFLSRELSLYGECIPISALFGENVSTRSEGYRTWYSGPCLLEVLEEYSPRIVDSSFRFQVQRVLFSSDRPDFRGYAGRILTGEVRVGDELLAGVDQKQIHISGIHTYDEPQLTHAAAGMSVVLEFNEQISCSRGDFLYAKSDSMQGSDQIKVRLIHVGNQPLRQGETLVLKRGSETIKGRVLNMNFAKDLSNFLSRDEKTSDRNDLPTLFTGEVQLKLQREVLFDSFEKNREIGSFLLIHSATNQTLGVGIIL